MYLITLKNINKGIIKISGQNCNLLSDNGVTKIRSKLIGFIFQNHRLFPEFSSIENVIIPQLLEGQEKETANGRKCEYMHNSFILLYIHIEFTRRSLYTDSICFRV